MTLVLSIIHVLACVLIIAVILLQSGRGGGLGAGFGGASSAATQLFGGRGAGNFLSRSTVALAVVFFVTSLSLAYISSRPNSLLDLTETSGAEASNADTIVEKGSGPLVPLDDEGQPVDGSAPSGDTGAVDPTGATDSEPTKLDISDMLEKQMKQAAEQGAGDAAEEGAETEEAADPEESDQPEEKPEAKPEPKPEAKPEPKPEAKPEPKPEAKPEPKPEAKPEPTAEEEPAADDAADDSASEETPSE